MKTIGLLKWTMACALGALVVTSCGDDDNDGRVPVPDVVQSAFDTMYGNVGYVEWDREQGGYLVAEFRKDGKDHDAWFDGNGSWLMTEIDHGRNLDALPRAVVDGYNATAYAQAQWRIDDIDEIQRPAFDTFYIIEVEKAGQPDYDLYFDLNGTLFRELQGDGGGHHGDMAGNGLPDAVRSFIEANYAGATVVDFDRERNGYEVDIRHDGKSKELWFDSSYNWLRTSTDMTRNIPSDIRRAVEAGYPGKRIDDCDYVETAQGEKYYLVDLDNYGKDLKVTEDGRITEVNDY